MNKRLIIGISGASGAPLAVELLRRLHANHPDLETHLVVTQGGEMILRQEMGINTRELKELVHCYHENSDIGASIASGSFRTEGMVVIPCSMKTVAGIVSGYADSLLLRAADVCLKERRKLALVARESPLSSIHLHNLHKASNAGAIIIPPMLTYYIKPLSLEEMTCFTVNRILSQFDLADYGYQWEGMD